MLDPHRLLEEKAGGPLDRDAVRTRKNIVSKALLDQEGPRPGVLPTIATAKSLGLKLAVASSSPRQWVEGWLSRLDLLQHFQVIKTRDDVEKVKPDPALYVKALAALEVSPEEALALEDSLNGLRAARAAGIFTIAIPNPMTRHLPLDEADLLLDLLEGFPLEDWMNPWPIARREQALKSELTPGIRGYRSAQPPASEANTPSAWVLSANSTQCLWLGHPKCPKPILRQSRRLAGVWRLTG